jgi:hypothetical protein
VDECRPMGRVHVPSEQNVVASCLTECLSRVLAFDNEAAIESPHELARGGIAHCALTYGHSSR